MSGTSPDGGGFLAPSSDAVPFDRCLRCGKKVTAGASLCAEHNPGKVRGPSSTQMHATILIGVIAGIIGFLFLARLAVGNTGPFEVEIIGSGRDATGNVAMSYAITNEGDREGVADCRVTRDGTPRPDDLAFRSPLLQPGEAAILERTVEQPRNGTAFYDPELLTVVCR